MWQHHYVIHTMRMEALRAEAEREERWRLADWQRERSGRPSVPGPIRGAAARFAVAIAHRAAAVARLADRAASRLDERITVDLGLEPDARDA